MVNKKLFAFLSIMILQFFGNFVFSQKLEKYTQKIEWTKDEFTKKYELQVQVFENKKFKDFYTVQTENNFVKVSFPSGTYRYRIFQFDLLDRKNEPGKWFNLEITQAIQPVIDSTDQKTYFIQKNKNIEITVNGSGISNKSSFFLIDKNKYELPCPASFSKEKKATVLIPAKNIVSGEYRIKIVNPPELFAVSPFFSIKDEPPKTALEIAIETDLAQKEALKNLEKEIASLEKTAPQKAEELKIKLSELKPKPVVTEKIIEIEKKVFVTPPPPEPVEKNAEELINDAIIARESAIEAANIEISRLSESDPEKARELELLVMEKLLFENKDDTENSEETESDFYELQTNKDDEDIESDLSEPIEVHFIPKIVEKELVVKEISVETKTVTQLDKSEIKILAGASPLISLYNNILSNSTIEIPFGISFEAGFIPLKKQTGFYGMNFSFKHFWWNEKLNSTSAESKATFVHFLFDYEHSLLYNHLQLGFEAGPGFSVFETKINEGTEIDDLKNDNSIYFSLMSQFSICYSPVSILSIKLSADYYHIFKKDSPPGIITPSLSIGLRL